MTATDNVSTLPRSGKPTDDAFDLQKSGTIRAEIDGTVYLLRRPKMGEFRALREALDTLAAEATEAQARGEKPDQEAGIVQWVRLAFDALADKSLPDDPDELPVWFSAPSLPATLVGHWRAVPTGRGVG